MVSIYKNSFAKRSVNTTMFKGIPGSYTMSPNLKNLLEARQTVLNFYLYQFYNNMFKNPLDPQKDIETEILKRSQNLLKKNLI